MFKNWVTTTNHRNVCRTLLAMESRQQTTRLLLDNAYARSHPQLTQAYHTLNKACPSLFKFTIAGVEIEPDEDIVVDSQHVRPDPKHANPAARVRIETSKTSDPWLSIKNNHKLGVTHSFNVALTSAYSKDYEMHNVATFEHWSIQWAKQLRFTDP